MNATEKRLARLNAQRHSSPDYSSDKALLYARTCKPNQASIEFHKDRAFSAINYGDMKRAVYFTQVCLWIMRLRKQAARFDFKPPPVGNYIMPTNAKYDAGCDRADRLNDAEKTGEIA
mgnify:FL=1